MCYHNCQPKWILDHIIQHCTIQTYVLFLSVYTSHFFSFSLYQSVTTITKNVWIKFLFNLWFSFDYVKPDQYYVYQVEDGDNYQRIISDKMNEYDFVQYLINKLWHGKLYTIECDRISQSYWNRFLWLIQKWLNNKNWINILIYIYNPNSKLSFFFVYLWWLSTVSVCVCLYYVTLNELQWYSLMSSTVHYEHHFMYLIRRKVVHNFVFMSIKIRCFFSYSIDLSFEPNRKIVYYCSSVLGQTVKSTTRHPGNEPTLIKFLW